MENFEMEKIEVAQLTCANCKKNRAISIADGAENIILLCMNCLAVERITKKEFEAAQNGVRNVGD